MNDFIEQLQKVGETMDEILTDLSGIKDLSRLSALEAQANQLDRKRALLVTIQHMVHEQEASERNKRRAELEERDAQDRHEDFEFGMENRLDIVDQFAVALVTGLQNSINLGKREKYDGSDDWADDVYFVARKLAAARQRSRTIAEKEASGVDQ